MQHSDDFVEQPSALDRLVEQTEMVRGMYPETSLRSALEHGLELAVVVLVDGFGPGESTDLDRALTDWLLHTRAPSGVFGQSMEATMSYETTRRLRAAAAAHLGRTGADVELFTEEATQ